MFMFDSYVVYSSFGHMTDMSDRFCPPGSAPLGMDLAGSRGGVLGVIEECFSAEEQEEADEEITVARNQLQEKVVEMENFAGHLEEIFLTVEVRHIH